MDLLWDRCYCTWYTHLEHPFLLQQLNAFGLRPCSPRTLAELSSAHLAMSLGVSDPDFLVSLASDHYVKQLRSAPISFFVSAVLYDPVYNLYLRTLLRHIRKAFNSSSAYEPRVLDRNLFQRFGYEDVPVHSVAVNSDYCSSTDDEHLDSDLPRDVAAELADLDSHRSAPTEHVAAPPAYQVTMACPDTASHTASRRFVFMNTSDSATPARPADREPNQHSPDLQSAARINGTSRLRSLVERLEKRLVSQTAICSDLSVEARQTTDMLMEETIRANCILFSSASRANRTVQQTVDAAVRYRTRLELEVPAPAKLFAKFSEPGYYGALKRIANSEQWRRDDLQDEFDSALAPPRSGPATNHTDTHPNRR